MEAAEAVEDVHLVNLVEVMVIQKLGAQLDKLVVVEEEEQVHLTIQQVEEVHLKVIQH
jgi:hypothetical protein